MIFARYARSFRDTWDHVWFKDKPTTTLEIVRIGLGAAMLLHYCLATPFLLLFWGDEGVISREHVLEQAEPWAQSIFFYLSAPWQWMVFHAIFLVSCAAFMIGWRTSYVKWIVLIGQLSYAYRNPALTYGVDKILCSLLLILCVAPTGRAMSLDRVRAVFAIKRQDIQRSLPRYSSRWAGACIRLMQIQMAALFFYSGIGKIRGDEWWDGDAIWHLFVTHEYYSSLMLYVLARQYWLVNFGSYVTMVIEIAFPFLVWQHRTRPYALAGAIFLHAQFALLMSLFYFSFSMIMGHMSFLRQVWLDRLASAWRQRMGDMEIVYDGGCANCVRWLAWFLAFDGLRQIRVRDGRTAPSPNAAPTGQAVYLVLPDARVLAGFEACRFVAPRVPGMWWMIPFFYVPVINRLVGQSIYRRAIANKTEPPRTAPASD